MSAAENTSPRRLILLGSTGSIGRSTVDVLEHLHRENRCSFNVVGLAAGNNVDLLQRQAEAFRVDHIALADTSRRDELGNITHVFTGQDAARELIEAVAQPGDLVLAAMVGSAGIPAVLAAIERGCDIALANKETLVAAGALVMPKVREHNVTLLPVDSEHSAIFQALASGRSTEQIQRVVITASGGPFRTWSTTSIRDATAEDALDHPTWSMGPKVTIDSATMMNKALEIIEAHWLFDLPALAIEAIVHPQSIVHSFVEFVDGSVLAQLSPPDMKMPIQYALTWPERLPGCAKRINWQELSGLEFEPVDHDRFPAVKLAYEVIEAGGTSGAVFNGANEVAVQAFLAEKIRFGDIAELVGDCLEEIPSEPITDIDSFLQADTRAREYVDYRVNHSFVAQ